MRIINFDWAMKYMLRQKENFDILDGFLSALLKKDIKVIEIIESESSSEARDLKLNKVDLMVKSEDEQFIIEIQNSRETDYFERILFGASKVIVESLKLGAKYKEVKKVISVNIMYFNLGDGEDYIYHGKTEFWGINKKDKLKIRKKVFINGKDYKLKERNLFPEYFLIRVEHFKEVIGSDIDEWVYMFKTGKIKDNFKSKGMDSVKTKLSYLKMNNKEQSAYDNYVVDLEREKDIIDTAERKGYAKAQKIIEKAQKREKEAQKEKIEAQEREKEAQEREKEAQEREKEAQEREKEAQKSLIDTVKLLLSMNTEIKKISEVTGLSIEEIKRIK